MRHQPRYWYVAAYLAAVVTFVNVAARVAVAEPGAGINVTAPPLDRIVDLGLTACVLGFLTFVFGKWILPRMLAQHEALVTELLQSYREEQCKNATNLTQLVASIERMQAAEQGHNKYIVGTITAEWQRLRDQLHCDSSEVKELLAELVKHAK